MTDRRAFENWFTKTYSDLQFNKCGMFEAWQAATLFQQSKIEALEIQVQELREALIVCKQYITEAIIDDKYHEASCSLDELYLLRDKAINLHKQALANTPNVSDWVRRDRLDVSCYELRIKCKGMIEKFHRATNVDGGEPLYRIKGE